ncbi:unnamed protein product [Mytilus edulis]|uniref:Cadherin domain-containing protein n=1 Tax=Mytilus edulis TaxID=6550 RepID=A0A8S3RQU8_MYTED|nr:unnamed protein product [Mytilus edulis]
MIENVDGDDRDHIIIHHEKSTGVIKFRYSNHTLDREGEDFGQVIVGVIATDKGEHPKNSSTLAFKIKITDINDQYAPNGTCIGEVNATDLDENPETLYYIDITESSVGSVVEIDKSTGKIVKSGNMSLSSTQNVQIKGNVFAQDGKDLKKLPSHAEIIITIEFDDKNNHTPVFQKVDKTCIYIQYTKCQCYRTRAYETDVDWKTPAGSKIITVIAEDADKGKEGEVTLSIIGGNSRLRQCQTTDFGDNPGTCIQGAEHSKELLNIESERDKWSYALYGLVAALCLAILLSFVFLYKWRTSPVSETTPPVGKMKYFDNPIPYDHLKKRETVEYSHSNESFDPQVETVISQTTKTNKYLRYELSLLGVDVTEPEGEARYRRPPDNKHLHSSRPLSFEEPTPDYPVYEFEGKVTKPTIPSTSRTSENC